MITIIAAVSENGVIGKNGKIPWKIPEDQQRFRELTWGNTVIMGRKTFEEIGRPLPGRKTVLISTSLRVETECCTTVGSFAKALEKTAHEPEIFIAGGSRVYQEALPYAGRIHLTVIHEHVHGDTFFPDFSGYGFEKISIDTQDRYTVIIYEKMSGFYIDKTQPLR